MLLHRLRINHAEAFARLWQRQAYNSGPALPNQGIRTTGTQVGIFETTGTF
jgi:hypothetical protein